MSETTNKTYKYRLILRKEAYNAWALSAYVPLEGEPCYDTTNQNLRIGNGVDVFVNLPSFTIGDLNEFTKSELQKISSSNGSGWRLLGVDEDNYEAIGMQAIDLSLSTEQTGNGALGSYSLAQGFNTKAQNRAQSTFGTFNTGTSTNTIMEVGIGLSNTTRKNALEVYTSGEVRVPQLSMDKITNNYSIITKEYLDSKVHNIKDAITKTIGVDADFETLQELQLWMNSKVFEPNSKLEVILDNGVYDFDVLPSGYILEVTNPNVILTIKGSSYDDVTIKANKGDSSYYKGVFFVSTNCNLKVSGIETRDNEDDTSFVHYVSIQGNLSVYNSKGKGGKRFISGQHGSNIITYNIVLEDFIVSNVSVIKIETHATLTHYSSIKATQDNSDAEPYSIFGVNHCSTIETVGINVESTGYTRFLDAQHGINNASIVGFTLEDGSTFEGDLIFAEDGSRVITDTDLSGLGTFTPEFNKTSAYGSAILFNPIDISFSSIVKSNATLTQIDDGTDDILTTKGYLQNKLDNLSTRSDSFIEENINNEYIPKIDEYENFYLKVTNTDSIIKNPTSPEIGLKGNFIISQPDDALSNGTPIFESKYRFIGNNELDISGDFMRYNISYNTINADEILCTADSAWEIPVPPIAYDTLDVTADKGDDDDDSQEITVTYDDTIGPGTISYYIWMDGSKLSDDEVNSGDTYTIADEDEHTYYVEAVNAYGSTNSNEVQV